MVPDGQPGLSVAPRRKKKTAGLRHTWKSTVHRPASICCLLQGKWRRLTHQPPSVNGSPATQNRRLPFAEKNGGIPHS